MYDGYTATGSTDQLKLVKSGVHIVKIKERGTVIEETHAGVAGT